MSPAAMPGFTLKVQINGIAKQKGFIMAEVKSEKGEVVKQIKQDVRASGTLLTIPELPAGRYAVAVFHDANGDGKLNTNLVGMPTEAYGFSNDARGVFGPPSLNDQLVTVNRNLIIELKVK